MVSEIKNSVKTTCFFDLYMYIRVRNLRLSITGAVHKSLYSQMKRQQIVFATNNLHKLAEVRKIVNERVEVLSLADINCLVDIPETGSTLEENALLKARYVSKHYGFVSFADDSGLEVDALGGAPGVYSARYAGEQHDAQANMDKLLLEMKDIPNREARFRTVVALVLPNEEHLFDGEIAGVITTQKQGDKGFGYDPIFVPQGYIKTFAELGDEVKNSISHRAKAVDKLVRFIDSYLVQ